MRLNLNQCAYWRFNFMWNEYSTAISIWIYDDNWQIYKEENWKRVNCLLKLQSSEDDITDHVRSYYENLELNELISMVDTTNYLQEYLFFIDVYNKNKEQIISSHVANSISKIEKEIEHLEKKKKAIESDFYVDDISIPSSLKADMIFYKSKALMSLDDYVEWSDTYISKLNEKLKYKDKYNNIAIHIWYDVLD